MLTNGVVFHFTLFTLLFFASTLLVCSESGEYNALVSLTQWTSAQRREMQRCTTSRQTASVGRRNSVASSDSCPVFSFKKRESVSIVVAGAA